MNHEETEMICRNCRWLEPIGSDPQIGHCIRYAPRPINKSGDETYYPSWPHVLTDYRCGEFEAK